MGDIAGADAQVRPAAAADHEPAAEALALAFAEDPVWSHLLPGSETRAEKLLAYFSSDIETLTPDYREVWVTDDGSGVAIWARPGSWQVPFMVTMREAARMMRVFGRRLPLGLRTLMRLERHHPKPEHWYLNYLGVEPHRQGRGLGGALLAPILERCDREVVPAYLEATTERNIALYERNGFTATGVFDAPGRGGPPIRKMWREPA
jgi:GNAT superfamily N-acetyltransferase